MSIERRIAKLENSTLIDPGATAGDLRAMTNAEFGEWTRKTFGESEAKRMIANAWRKSGATADILPLEEFEALFQ